MNGCYYYSIVALKATTNLFLGVKLNKYIACGYEWKLKMRLNGLAQLYVLAFIKETWLRSHYNMTLISFQLCFVFNRTALLLTTLSKLDSTVTNIHHDAPTTVPSQTAMNDLIQVSVTSLFCCCCCCCLCFFG